MATGPEAGAEFVSWSAVVEDVRRKVLGGRKPFYV